MASKKEKEQNDTAVEVKKIPPRPKVSTGRPRKIIAQSMRTKVAYPTVGGTLGGSGGNFYSPELSTDFLELPQSIDEQRNYYRFWYKSDSFVGQAIDLHTELPLSKLRLGMPKAQNRKLAQRAVEFCEKWCQRNAILHRLIEIVHDYHLLGEVFIFAEDNNPEMPREIREEAIRELTPEGTAIERWQLREDADERAIKWLKRNYKGWTAIRVLPPEQIHMEAFPFTDEKIIELVPDSKTKDIVQKANMGDRDAERIVNSMPEDVVSAILTGRNIPLNCDPDAGSFVYYMCRKKSQYEPRGSSLLERCLLPGTPITIKREGIIQQVPVEDVDIETDLLLTHKGRFRKATKGSRPINEEVTVLSIEGIEHPLAVTSDHRILRVSEDGSEEWVEAAIVEEGDLVREAHVVPEGDAIVEINLEEWWQDREIVADRHYRKNQKGFEIRNRKVKASDASVSPSGELVVSFQYEQDDACRIDAVKKSGRLINCLKNLEEPTEISYDVLRGITGHSYAGLRSCVSRLRSQIGLKTERVFKGRGKGNGTLWYPIAKETHVPGAFVEKTLSSPVKSLRITKDFMYLVGTWLGDGCIWTAKELLLNTHSIGWSIHQPEMKTRILDLIEEALSDSGVIQGNLRSNTGHQGDIRIEDPLLARWFMEEFGHGFAGKNIPAWVFDLSKDHIKALLQGVLDTDGWVSKKGTSLSISLRNKELVEQLHLLATRVGFQTQVKKITMKPTTWDAEWESRGETRTKTYNYGERDCWILTCNRSQNIQAWTERGVKQPDQGKSQQKYTWKTRFKDGWLTRKISKKETVQYQGLVYSFDVEEDESMVAQGVVVHNCMRTLVFRDKIRQAETSIASRHMTPIRIIWAEGADEADVEELRDQVDMALADPDYSIVTNFQVNWEEMGSDQRVPDWSNLYDRTDRQMYSGLGVTESLLSGESSYSGDRINLEVINTRYMLLREILQNLIEEQLFKPMCRRMGFIESDDYDEEIVIYPTVSFTRLALRDNSDTFDHLFNLYQKGSLDIDIILELLNIDPERTKEKLERDMWSVNDSQFNEMIRGVYNDAATKLVEGTKIIEMIAEKLGLDYEPPKEDGGRF
jgi:intein/homing endonuclease